MAKLAVILLLLASFLNATLLTATALAADTDLFRRVRLQWEVIREAREYEIQLGLTPTFETPLHAQKIRGATEFVVDLSPGTYYYRVRGLDKIGRPGAWTATQDLRINAKPPVLLMPTDGKVFSGDMPDNGLPMQWKGTGSGVRYLLEIRIADENGGFTRTVVRQEFADNFFDFFPRENGRYQWSVGSLGPSGVELSALWEFEVNPRSARDGKVEKAVRYVSPWWRNHWTFLARYGQAPLSYRIRDQELSADTSFNGMTGYLVGNLYWEWHDPLDPRLGGVRLPPFGGIPWWDAELELNRQTVLSESIILPRYAVRFGFWYETWLPRWRWTPLFEYGAEQVTIYQPRSPREAARSTADRTYLGVGAGSEFQLLPFLKLLGSFKLKFEKGGEAGFRSIAGDQLDLTRRAGDLKASTAVEVTAGGAMQLGSRMQLQGTLRYEKNGGSWVPTFYAPRNNGFPEGDTQFALNSLSFDLAVGVKF